MIAARTSLILMAAALAAESAGAGPLRYVNSRQLLLSFSADNEAAVETVDVWASRDGGKTWQSIAAERFGTSSLRCEVDEDGWYGFYLVLRNAAGASADPPRPGSEPHLRVIVDTVPPTLQVHAHAEALAPVAGQPLNIRLSLIDEHLGDTGIRVFYRPAGTNEWTDGGLAVVSESRISWTVPERLAGQFDLRLAATDRAGNRSIDELAGVVVRAPQQPTTAPATEPLGADEPTDTEAPSPTPELPAVPTMAEQEHLVHLRALAQRLLAERRFPLAADRFEEALRIAPGDADMLVDLGSALYWSGRYDDADNRFAAALEGQPDHVGALDGLALVAATQKRYSHARTHLERLLALLPESAVHWRRYGDVQHRLGNKAAALEAWARILDLDHADPTVRAEAQKRLDYFGPATRP